MRANFSFFLHLKETYCLHLHMHIHAGMHYLNFRCNDKIAIYKLYIYKHLNPSYGNDRNASWERQVEWPVCIHVYVCIRLHAPCRIPQ